LFLQTNSTFASEKDLMARGGTNKKGWMRKIFTSTGTRSKNYNFINKFYQPYVDKLQYNIHLNENMSEIKSMTSQDAKINNYLDKKNKEVAKISHDLIIYNNPSNYIAI